MDLWRMSEALQSLASSPSTPPLTAHPEQAGTIQASPPQLPPRVPAIPSPSCCSSVEAVNFPPPLPHSPGMSPLIPIHPNPQGDGHLGVYPTCFSEMVGILQTAPLVSAPPHSAWHTGRAQRKLVGPQQFARCWLGKNTGIFFYSVPLHHILLLIFYRSKTLLYIYHS